MELLAIVTGDLPRAAAAFAEASSPGLVFNGFWIVVSAVNFIFFLVILQQFAFGPVSRMLGQRHERIEQGLRDADAARQEREQSALDRNEVLADARRQANEIVQRAQAAAQEARERDLAATQEELMRLRTQAAADIEAEKHRAMIDVRTEIADLALQLAGRVVGETFSEPRERRLVEQFLVEVDAGATGSRGGSPGSQSSRGGSSSSGGSRGGSSRSGSPRRGRSGGETPGGGSVN